MVSNTSVLAIWVGSILKRSRSSTMRSASLPGFERPFRLFAVSRKSRAQSIGPDCSSRLMRSPGTKPPGGSPSVVCRVSAFCTPGQGFNVTTGQSLPKARTPPCSRCCARPTLAARAPDQHCGPNFQRVVVRIGVQRLKAGNDSKFAEARNVSGARWSRCARCGGAHPWCDWLSAAFS